MHKPLISIVMAAKNAEGTISAAIASVLQQDYENWELLVVNNASSDQTQAKIDAFSDPRIRTFSCVTPGVSSARNTALNQTKGSLLCFLDADDYLPGSSLRKREERFSRLPEVAFVDGLVHFYNLNFEHLTRIHSPTLQNSNPFAELLALQGSCFAGITWMVRWDSENNTRFDSSLTHGEDLLFFTSLAAKGGNYAFVDTDVYHVQTTPNSAMRDLSGQEAGYKLLEERFSDLSQNKSWRPVFRKKARRILIRSYLKRAQFLAATRVVFRYLKT
jgi:teichuronic acid biosynthesis glycosyltransferase TuaG